jgi:hypothetical protein
VLGAKTHFEVHGQSSGSWTVQCVCDQQSNAIESAESYFRDLNLSAVKVLQVTYSDDAASFNDKEVFFSGTRTKSNVSEVDLILPICQKPEDLYLPEARRAIYASLKKALSGWNITVLELLYGAENVQRLNDTGQILQGAVQKIAISQVQKTGQKVNERVLELYGLTNEILQELKTRRQTSDLSIKQGADLKSLYDMVRSGSDPKKDFFIALTHYFKSIPKIDAKFEKILSFLQDYDDEDILYFLDHYLADFLNAPEHVKKLLGEEENLGDAMLSLIDLIKGNAVLHPDRHIVLARLNDLMKANRLPETRRSLVHKFKGSLRSNASFDKKDPLSNVLYHRRILSNMQLPDDRHVGGKEAIDLLYGRCEKMTGSSSIALYLGDLEHPLQRAEKLLDVAMGFVGTANLRALANYILPILESEYNRKIIISEAGEDIRTLNRMSALQRKVRKPGFPEYFQQRILEDLDALALEGVRREKMLPIMVAKAADPVTAGITLLEVISKGDLPRPSVMMEYREFARKLIITEAFLASLKEMSGNREKGLVRLQHFYKLLEETRIDQVS